MEPKRKWQQLILNPEKREWGSPPSSMYLGIKNILKAFGGDPARFSDLLLNPRWPFPNQSHCCKKAEVKDNSLLPPRGTCLDLHSQFSGQHVSTVWLHRDKQKKWDGVVRGYLITVFFQGFWMGYLDDFICLSTKSFFT